jgi:hypothetical protein
MRLDSILPEPLFNAVRRFSDRCDTDRYLTYLSTGGYSDDCHGVGGQGPGFDRATFDKATGEECDAKAVCIDVPGPCRIVLTTVYEDGGWHTYIALPAGCTVEGKTLEPGEGEGEDTG